MKSAEEWLEVFQQTECVLWKKEIFKEFVRKIQSDAHQSGVLEGLRLAAEKAMSGRTNPAYAVYNLGAEDASVAILSLAEQIKSQGVKS